MVFEKQQPPSHKKRIRLFQGLIVCCLVILSGQLWYLQIANGAFYRRQVLANGIRLQTVLPQRGIIYDRNGLPLVRNTPTYTVSVTPHNLPKDRRHEVLTRLAHILGLPPVVVEGVYLEEATESDGVYIYLPQQGYTVRHDFRVKVAGHKSIPIDHRDPRTYEAANTSNPINLVRHLIDHDKILIIAQERENLPGVTWTAQSIREYVSDSGLAHLLGYVGVITPEEYQAHSQDGYTETDTIGKTGLEYMYETQLRGKQGVAKVEVDAAGRVVNQIQETPPLPGYNLRLTIDLNLQRFVAKRLQQQLDTSGQTSGAAVIMDPRNGQVLAMVSLPDYDNNLFSRGISAEDFTALQTDPRHPFINRAMAATYPPGSIYKIITASAGLETGVINPYTYINDAGIIRLPNLYHPGDFYDFKGWTYPGGLGTVNVIGALAESSDIFFYTVGGGNPNTGALGVGNKRLASFARLYGLGAPTGIDLPGEQSGLVPDADWLKKAYNQEWQFGQTYDMAIGQGYNLVTPLQMANVISAVANSGTLYKPQLANEFVTHQGKVVRPFTPLPLRSLNISSTTLNLVRTGLRNCVQPTDIKFSIGTCYVTNIPGLPVAGKTGTAETSSDNKQPIAWFVGYAPAYNPELAIAVVVPGAGEGAENSVPIAKDVFHYYFHIPEEKPKEQPTPKP